jgi:flagellar basal-body rod protein FlgC
MPLFSIFDIAGSAMNAESVRLNLTASNLANAQTVSSSENTVYRAREPVFASVLNGALDGSATGGVRVAGVIESRAPSHKEYAPDNPLADAQGYIHLPNVNVIEEMANMMSATRAYQNNVEVLNTSKQLLLSTLSLGK